MRNSMIQLVDLQFNKKLFIQRMMTATYQFKKIGNFVLPPVRPEYQYNLAQSIQAIFKRQSSSIKIITLDLLSFADAKERLKGYKITHKHAYRLFVQLAGKYFSTSPNEIKTQLPLMILTDKESIFLRRIKRLKNIQSKQSFKGSSSSYSSQKNISQNSQNSSNSQYLVSNISQKNFSSLLNSSKSIASFMSQMDIFNASYSINQSDVDFNLRTIIQSIKQSALRLKALTGIHDEEKQLVKIIKNTKQQQVEHLVCNQEPASIQISAHSRRQQQVNTLKSEKQSDKIRYLANLGNLYEPNAQKQEQIMEKLPIQIKHRLRMQLNRYKLSSAKLSVSISGTNKCHSKKKVREKAQQMLKKLGLHSIYQ